MDDKFKKDDIVYWVKDSRCNPIVEFGVVDYVDRYELTVSYLSLRERRKINNVPILEFYDDRYHKLPKNYLTSDLYEITFDEFKEGEEELLKSFKINNPDEVKTLLELGYITRIEDTFYGKIDVEYERGGIYRIVKKYSPYPETLLHFSRRKSKFYKTFEEAHKAAEKIKAEYDRVAALSDEEWSIEQIETVINNYIYMYGKPKEDFLRYKEYFMSLPHIEDIERRVFNGAIQWKYWKNQKWKTINLEV